MHKLDLLGPWPKKAVAVFVDLGLTETEIARYFGVTLATVRAVRNGSRAMELRDDIAR